MTTVLDGAGEGSAKARGPKNRTGIDPHPPAHSPVISVVEADYVRSSEIRLAYCYNHSIAGAVS
jgi:hypothetical protein